MAWLGSEYNLNDAIAAHDADESTIIADTIIVKRCFTNPHLSNIFVEFTTATFTPSLFIQVNIQNKKMS